MLTLAGLFLEIGSRRSKMNDGVKTEDSIDYRLGVETRTMEELSNALASLNPEDYEDEELQRHAYGPWYRPFTRRSCSAHSPFALSAR